MIRDTISRLWYGDRVPDLHRETSEEVDAYVNARALAYPSKLEDDFVRLALNLGVASGMILEVGARVGLISLKMLWQNEDFYAIGVDNSVSMVDRARETATAWELGERAFFQVGDARRMRFKTAYFDIAISDCTLHSFDDPVAVLAEVHRVTKPRGAILIRDLRRPARFRMSGRVKAGKANYGETMGPRIQAALRAAWTPDELRRAISASGLQGASVLEVDRDHLMVERRGETDPNSWIKAREQYR
jgi:ubiquinone/menaquinone biosynthesis C-methylase UbiE